MQTQPSPQHHWLKQLLGEWTYESAMSMTPDQPREVSRGTESVRALGEVWIIAEGKGETGEQVSSVMTIGFDPEKGRFNGSFIAAMTTLLWVYDGELSEDGKKLTLESQGPSMADDGTEALYRDIIEIIDAKHRTLTSTTQGKDGEWAEFGVSHYYRVV